MATYYVSAQRGSDANDGLSQAAPWATITKAVGEVAAGDIVYIGPGGYKERVSLLTSGTFASPIRFIPDPSCKFLTGDTPGIVRSTITEIEMSRATPGGGDGVVDLTGMDTATQTSDRTYGWQFSPDPGIHQMKITHLGIYPLYTATHRVHLWNLTTSALVTQQDIVCTGGQWNYASITDQYLVPGDTYAVTFNHPTTGGNNYNRLPDAAAAQFHSDIGYIGGIWATNKDTLPASTSDNAFGVCGFKFEYEPLIGDHVGWGADTVTVAAVVDDRTYGRLFAIIGGRPLEITHLGVLAAYSETHNLSLWRASDQSLVESINVACTANRWNYGALTTPLRVLPGESFVVSFNHPTVGGTNFYRAAAILDQHISSSAGRSATAHDTYPTTALTPGPLTNILFEVETGEYAHRGKVWDFNGKDYNELGAENTRMYVDGSMDNYAVDAGDPDVALALGRRCKGLIVNSNLGIMGGRLTWCSIMAWNNAAVRAFVDRCLGMVGTTADAFVECVLSNAIGWAGRYSFTECVAVNCRSIRGGTGFHRSFAYNCEAYLQSVGFSGTVDDSKYVNCKAVLCNTAISAPSQNSQSVMCNSDGDQVLEPAPLALHDVSQFLQAFKPFINFGYNDGGDDYLDIGDGGMWPGKEGISAATTAADYTFGGAFRPRENREVTHLTIYARHTATHKLHLWRDSDQASLATVEGACTADEWNALALATPVSLVAGEKYVVSYNHPTAGGTDYYQFTDAWRGHPDMEILEGRLVANKDTFPVTSSIYWRGPCGAQFSDLSDIAGEEDMLGYLRRLHSGTIDIGPFERSAVNLQWGVGDYRTQPPGISILRKGQQKLEFWAKGGEAFTKTVWVRWENVTADKPQLLAKGAHIADQTSTATGTGVDWEQLSVSATPSADGKVDLFFYQRETGATAVAYFSDLDVS